MQRLLRLFSRLALSGCCFAVATAAPTDARILVLPFANQADPGSRWIGESSALRLSEVLAARRLAVVDREDRLEVCRRLGLHAAGPLSRAAMLKLAEELDAASILTGEFELRSPATAGASAASGASTIRLHAFLIDVRHLRKGPSWVEQGSLDELSQLQNRLGWQILRSLAPEQTPPLEKFLAEQPAVRLDAVENYVRGLLASTAEQKHRYWTQAARLDPAFSPPCYQLGRLAFERKEYRVAAGWLTRVSERDPNFLHAAFLIGLCRYHLGDFAGALTAFERVVAQAPLNEAINNLAVVQSRLHLPQALENFLKAIDGDPSDPDYHFNAGYLLWKRGEFEPAAERFRAAAARNPGDAEATRLLGRCLQGSGPRANDPRDHGLERLKPTFNQRAWQELKARVSNH